MIWLLHLVPDARPFIAEAARVLRAGGVLLTTVDKAELHGYARGVPATDSAELITRIAGDHHLAEFGRATFVGHGQGRDGSPDPVFTVAGFERLG
jgi:hypothetical protein